MLAGEAIANAVELVTRAVAQLSADGIEQIVVERNRGFLRIGAFGSKLLNVAVVVGTDGIEIYVVDKASAFLFTHLLDFGKLGVHDVGGRHQRNHVYAVGHVAHVVSTRISVLHTVVEPSVGHFMLRLLVLTQSGKILSIQFRIGVLDGWVNHVESFNVGPIVARSQRECSHQTRYDMFNCKFHN